MKCRSWVQEIGLVINLLGSLLDTNMLDKLAEQVDPDKNLTVSRQIGAKMATM